MSKKYRGEDSQRKLNVLLAEDDTYQRIMISDLLDLCGFNVTDCENGLQARDELLKTDNDFDVIILDLMMPEINGLELLKLIKTIDRLKEIPVFMMSSDNENQVVAICLGEGAYDYIVKPVSYLHLKKLKEKVQTLQLTKTTTDHEKAYYAHVRNLGRGAAGSVELVRRSSDNELFAMKVIPMHFMNEQERKNAENEVHLLRVLVGPTIIRYYESFTEQDSINIIMEHAEGGSLDDAIQEQKKTSKPFEKDQILYWMAQMVIAVQFMHHRNVLHRDIKTQNLFLKKNIIKLGDFGISKSLGTHNDFAKTFLGTPYFMSPEVCKGEPYGAKADIWALGCAIYELVALKRPFQHDVMQVVFDLIINKPYAELRPDVDKDLANLIDRMLQKDPNKRPSIWELAKIPCIEQKIQKFYNEHPQEKTDFGPSRDNDKTGPPDEKRKPTQIEDNMEDIVFKLREEVKFSKHFKGTFRYNTFFALSGQELFDWFKKNESQKNDDEIRDLLKQMYVSKLIHLVEGGNPNIQEFQINQNAWYSFSRDLPNIPANLTKIYLGEQGSAIELISEALNEGKRIQGNILKIQTLDQASLKSLISDYLQFKAMNQRLQKASLTVAKDQNINVNLTIFLNLYQLMRLHKNLRGFFNDMQQMQFNQNAQGILSKIFSIFMPYISSEQTSEEFSYQFLGMQFSIDEIKHGILRSNTRSKYSNFRPWVASNPKFQYILPPNPKVIFLFHEDSNLMNNKQKTITNLEKLKWPIDLFKSTSVESRLEEIAKKWISINVCLDTVENDIHIHPLLQAYITDLGGTNESLLKWIFKYMNVNVDQEQIINDLKDNRFYVSFQDPNEQS